MNLDQSNRTFATNSPFPRESSSEGATGTADGSDYFYRAPRHNHASVSLTEDRSKGTVYSIPSSSSSSSEADHEPNSSSMELVDMDMGKPSDIDYSVREADQYYHRTAGGEAFMSSSRPSSPAPVSGPRLPRWKQRKGKEKGFEVVRSKPSSG